MKQLIILVASIVLGMFLFTLISGPLTDSVRSVWQSEISSRTLAEYQP